MLDSANVNLVRPAQPRGIGVLVLSGSSGRLEVGRAEQLATLGVTALAVRWFGGVGQPPVPAEIPVDLFLASLDTLAESCDYLGILGTSFGAEAALVVASCDPRVTTTVALAPTSVVWPGWRDGAWHSHWTHHGVPLPFVPFAEGVASTEDPPSYLELYRASLECDPVVTARASIPVEQIAGELVLAAGGDDQVWPSVQCAQRIQRRRGEFGRATTVLIERDAGHRVRLPGEDAVGDGRLARGGTPQADAALGARLWEWLTVRFASN